MITHVTRTSDCNGQKERPYVYSIARIAGRSFSYKVYGLQNIRTPGPAIYISNHHGPVGPIAVILSVPVRFYPWIVAEMMDFRRAPRYLYDDFVHPVLNLKGKAGMVFSTFLTKISVRLLCAIGGVSIDRFGGMMVEGFRHSLGLLRGGKNLLIFPEDATLPSNDETSMRPFMPGFASLCDMYQSEQHEPLPVYPMAVFPASKSISIGKPEFFRQEGDHREAIDRFTVVLENRVRMIYLGLKDNHIQ